MALLKSVASHYKLPWNPDTDLQALLSEYKSLGAAREGAAASSAAKAEEALRRVKVGGFIIFHHMTPYLQQHGVLLH